MFFCYGKILPTRFEASYHLTMTQQSWLFAWIGEADHKAGEADDQGRPGPIASALLEHERFDRVVLLTNYGFARSEPYCKWLEELTGCVEVDLYQVELSSPINYAEIYEKVSAELKTARLPRPEVELTFHLSPGTPAMTAVWILLAKTRFPARLIQTSAQRGLERVDFRFDLASDFLPEYLKRSEDRIERLASERHASPEFAKIVHRSEVMRKQIGRARRIAAFDVPVLILGETGTGKELFAQAVHASSKRAGKAFIPINCGAIAKELANAELFGHKKGAFTGADRERDGHFVAAQGGTLFLDEVGDLPADTQVRLLRALQEKEITPVGSSKPVKIDVRIIAATHRNLQADVAAGRFREDLFHRLAVGILHLPALRQREDDIALLIDHFLDQLNSGAGFEPEVQHKNVSPDGRKLLVSHVWPGNVRELYHTLVRAAIWSESTTIQVEDVQEVLLQTMSPDDGVLGRPLRKGFDLQAVLDEVALHYLERAMEQAGNKKKQAAALLGFSHYQTLTNWRRRYGLESADDKKK